MLYLIWALINFLSGILLLFLCLKLFKWIRFKLGLVLSLGFLLLLVSLTSFSPAYTADAPLTWKFNAPGKEAFFFKQQYHVTLDKTPLFSIQLHFQAAETANHSAESALEAFSTLEGVSGSHRWVPTSIDISSRNHVFYYRVNGFLEWRLLNCIICREAKHFEGEVED